MLAFAIKHTAFINSLPAVGNFCHLLITVGNSFDPDQPNKAPKPALDPLCDTPERFFLKKVNLKKTKKASVNI